MKFTPKPSENFNQYTFFFTGGRQFNSLSDLVAYYTHCSDLLKRERLIHPTPPPEPVNDKKRIVAILPYTKMPDTDELTFQKGDIFFVHNDMGDGWLWVTAHRTGEQGLIFRELVDDLDDSIDPNTVFSWFHPNVTKSEAVDMLVKAGPGSFLVSLTTNRILFLFLTKFIFNVYKRISSGQTFGQQPRGLFIILSHKQSNSAIQNRKERRALFNGRPNVRMSRRCD